MAALHQCSSVVAGLHVCFSDGTSACMLLLYLCVAVVPDFS
jgi:hypothetical protein